MNKRQALGSRLGQQIMLFSLGGAMYNICELCWSGSTHGSMFFVGGLCFQMIGWIHATFYRLDLFRRCVLCSLSVTTVEFVSGILLNRVWKLGVWDYSNRFLNIAGQICLLYTLIWGVLGAVSSPVYRYLYTRLTGKYFPYYKKNRKNTVSPVLPTDSVPAEDIPHI